MGELGMELTSFKKGLSEGDQPNFTQDPSVGSDLITPPASRDRPLEPRT